MLPFSAFLVKENWFCNKSRLVDTKRINICKTSHNISQPAAIHNREKKISIFYVSIRPN